MRPSRSIKLKLFRLQIGSVALALLCMSAASAATVRSKADMRLWETVPDRSAPLTWAWEDAADSATLVCSNRLTKVCFTDVVPRTIGATHGSCGHPVAQTEEALVDVTLSQMNGASVVSCESAVLAYVSGSGGGPITVRAKKTREWDRWLNARIHAVDPAWQGEVGDSGYDVAWPVYSPLKIIVK